jgi:class 3 adenylate cyclase
MSDLTNQRVIILVLSMLIVIPALTITETDLTLNLATRMINRMAILNATNSSVYSEGLTFAISNVIHNSPVIRIVFTDSDGNNLYYQDPVIHSLRREEILTYHVDNSDPYLVTTLQFNSKYNSIQNAVYDIYTTFFVMFLLVCGTYFFSNDVKKLVIKPIERMVELVRDISANPLGVEYKMLGAADGFHEGLETTVLLSTITKIGGLMRVGFGEAGASVIARNLEESSGGKLNLMGTGTMINSIFGFCDIRNFTDTTECLQEEVMLFVNRIAHILHGIVVQCSGSANKNIGDAFLLTWKIDESVLNTPQSYFLADQALLAFLKTLVELIRHEDFICNFSTAATTRLYKRFPGYNVRIGCGLHYGWAIEGAIGSNRKIDASYLSPHVNFTEFLESSTKTYDVPLLMSEPFYRMLSPIVARHCRQVDRIRRTEAEAPVSLYTYDADLSINFSDFARKRLYGMAPRKSLQPTARPALKRQTETKIDKKVYMLDVESNFSGIAKNAPTINLPPYTPDIWESDDDLLELRHKTTGAEFRKKWPQGVSDYLQGNWVEAAQCFRRTLELTNNQDGPSKFLLKVMSETNFEAPEDWPGYRIEGGGH